jgi:RNA polymerase sigma-70 factor (ECF subfamily)
MNGDELRERLEALHAASVGWALSCCAWSRRDAEDVLQSSYLKILSGAARFEGRSSLKTFVFGVIRRTASERRRRSWLREIALARWWERRSDPGPMRDPEALAQQSECSRMLVRALRMLPDRQRDLLHLVFYQDLSVDEAAHVLGVSAGTARTHFDRGKKRLRAILDGRLAPR